MANVLVIHPRRRTIETVFMTSPLQMLKALEIDPNSDDMDLIQVKRAFGVGGYLYCNVIEVEDEDEHPVGFYTDFPGNMTIHGPCVLGGEAEILQNGTRPSAAVLTADELRGLISFREVTDVARLAEKASK
jgi:hypothetical protein